MKTQKMPGNKSIFLLRNWFLKGNADVLSRAGYCKAVPVVLFFLFSPELIWTQTSPAGVLTSANCKLWVDAGDINGDGNYSNNPATGSSVSAWNDKSGNGNNLTQGTA